MFKIFTFLTRNAALSRDDFRAGLIGYHAGHSRRMKGVRGYLVNIQSTRALPGRMAGTAPAGFTDAWDGAVAMYFDGPEGWRGASEPERTRATAEGLAIDTDRTPADGPFLFDPQPGRTDRYRSRPVAVEEIPLVPVERPEHKLTKIVQFFRRAPHVAERDWRTSVIGHGTLATGAAGLCGYTLNLRDRDEDAALRGVYPADDYRYSPEGRAWRGGFTQGWDGFGEMWFESVEAAVAAHAARPPELAALEQRLFEAVWAVEVDESVVVMPNRDPAPDFYYR